MHDLRSAAVVCLLSIALLATGVRADDRHEGGLWLVNQLAVPLDDRFTFHAMLQNRWRDDVEKYERTVVRPWVNFAWTERVDLSLGYDRHENRRGRDEHRAWPRIAYRHPLGRTLLFSHAWLEARFFERTKRVTWRARFQIGGSIELPNRLGLILRNEFLFDLNETSRVRRSGFGEDQLYAGFFYPLTSWLRFDAGYLMQYRDRKNRDLFTHNLSLGFSLRTPSLGELF